MRVIVGAIRIEPQDPVTHDLKGDIAKTRCNRARASAIDQGKRQKTTRLRRMLALAGQTPKTFRVKIRP
jgi:hypothetical protein